MLRQMAPVATCRGRVLRPPVHVSRKDRRSPNGNPRGGSSPRLSNPVSRGPSKDRMDRPLSSKDRHSLRSSRSLPFLVASCTVSTRSSLLSLSSRSAFFPSLRRMVWASGSEGARVHHIRHRSSSRHTRLRAPSEAPLRHAKTWETKAHRLPDPSTRAWNEPGTLHLRRCVRSDEGRRAWDGTWWRAEPTKGVSNRKKRFGRGPAHVTEVHGCAGAEKTSCTCRTREDRPLQADGEGDTHVVSSLALFSRVREGRNC